MWRHDDDESWVGFTWRNTWAAKVMDMDYMEIFCRWTDGTLFTMSNLDIGWMSSLWDIHMFAEWELVMALMANTSRLTNALDMMRHGSSWWSCIHWRLHIMVILEYLTHWGAEVRIVPDFDAVWDAYLGAHLWGVFGRSYLMEMIEPRHFGVWWRCSDGCLGGTHFGMGLSLLDLATLLTLMMLGGWVYFAYKWHMD